MVARALAGQIAPIVESLMLSRDEIHKVIQQVTDVLSAVDLAVLFAFGWLLVPYTRIIYDFVNTKTVVPTKEEKDTTDTSTEENEENHFESTYLFFVVDHLKQIARLALLVYACDCVVVAVEAVGYKADIASKVFAKILYTYWLARRAASFKRYILARVLEKAPKNCDKIKFINRILDCMVYALLFVKILEYLSVETGMALGSIFALGSTGTLIISLGSQEIAKNVVYGVEMAASDRFYEGDNVHFGDGTKGYIVKMGFLRTKVRTYDGQVLDIPNTQLGGNRVTNISRTHSCRVITKLRFEYKDIQELPPVLEAVKEEIANSCSPLIKDKAFRAFISSFERDYVEVTVNCSFLLPPTGEDFWRNRHDMFLAIDRGVKKSCITYAIPVVRFEK